MDVVLIGSAHPFLSALSDHFAHHGDDCQRFSLHALPNDQRALANELAETTADFFIVLLAEKETHHTIVNKLAFVSGLLATPLVIICDQTLENYATIERDCPHHLLLLFDSNGNGKSAAQSVYHLLDNIVHQQPLPQWGTHKLG